MYTDEDLYAAAREGIFDKSSVDTFRAFMSEKAHTQSVDEENFRLISGFNDIFVSLAALILLISAGWITGRASPIFSFFTVAALSWLLSIFFVEKRRLALPAIIFLVSFVTGTVVCVGMLLAAADISKANAMLAAFAVGAVAAWIHWRQFRVPITVAAGVASVIVCLLIFVAQVDGLKPYLDAVVFALGIMAFLIAMRWDSQDTMRTTRKSDVAFWLHLLAAPLIVHPIFSQLGILEGQSSLLSVGLVIMMYVALAIMSIIVDRRALMVSALFYVLYAFSQLFDAYGMVSSSLAVSGALIGSVLLFLSAFWHKSRVVLLQIMPERLRAYVPKVV